MKNETKKQEEPQKLRALAQQIAELDSKLATAKNEPSLLERQWKARAELPGLKEQIATYASKHCGCGSCADEMPKYAEAARKRLDLLRFNYDLLDKLANQDLSLGAVIGILVEYDDAIAALEHFIENVEVRSASFREEAKRHHGTVKELKARAEACEVEIRVTEKELNGLRDQAIDNIEGEAA
jgi:predicted  nucleic acid-binding Zn-ribbon protein